MPEPYVEGRWVAARAGAPFTGENDAVAIAVDSIYGLAGAMRTRDADQAQRAAARLRRRTGWSTDHRTWAPQEWGRFRQSGVGRELGRAGPEEYRATTYARHYIRPTERRWFAG